MEWWIWITRWFLFCVTYSMLYYIYHQKHETLSITPIYGYINRINYRLVSKTKDGLKLKLKKWNAFLVQKTNIQNKKYWVFK